MQMVAHCREGKARHGRTHLTMAGVASAGDILPLLGKGQRKSHVFDLSDPRTPRWSPGSAGRQSWGCFWMACEATTRQHLNVTVRHATGQVAHPTAEDPSF